MTRPPVSLAGHVSFIHNGHAVSTGGVNENIFNGYFSDVELSKGNSALTEKVNRDYFSKPADDYFLNNHIISYDPSKNQWKNTGNDSISGNCWFIGDFCRTANLYTGRGEKTGASFC